MIAETYDIKRELISQLIKDGIDSYWFFFDAFDEIPSTDLHIQLISELDQFSNFIMTSRTYALANYTLPASSILKIQPYSTDNIYYLVDKRMNDLGNILSFYNFLRSSNPSNDDYLLRYPWLVIFLIEHFEAGNFELELLDNLPFEIMVGLQKKMRTSKVAEDSIEKFISETGALLFKRLFNGNLNIREIHKDELSKENIEVFDTLTSFGLISTASHLSSVFSISVPLLPELLMAHHLCNRSKSHFIQLLSLIYCRAEFKEIIVLSARIWVSHGNDIRDFDPKLHQFTCHGSPSANGYEHLLYYLTFRNIPSNFCYKFDDLIADYFEKLKSIFEERDEEYLDEEFELDAKELAIRETKEAFEEKIIDYLHFFSRKSEKHIDNFYKFVKKMDRKEMEPGLSIALHKNYKYIINCKPFSADALEHIQNNQYDKVYHDLVYMINSPVNHFDVYKILLNKILSNNITNENSNVLIEDHLWVLESTLLLLLKAGLTNEEILYLLDSLNKFKFYPDDGQYAKNKLGSTKSIVLTNNVLEYILTKVEQGDHIESFRSIVYLLQDMFLFNKDSQQTQETLNKLILRCHEYFIANASKNPGDSSHWDNIEYIYNQILRQFPFKGLEQSTYDFLKTAYHMYKQTKGNVTRVSTILYYLINMESTYALSFLESCNGNFIFTNQRFIDHPILEGQFKFSRKFLDEIRKVIARDINNMYACKNEVFEFIEKLKVKRLGSLDLKNTHKSFDLDMLLKECKSPDFHLFLEENPDIKYFKYALMYGIYNEKPVFAQQMENKLKYYYSCSETF